MKPELTILVNSTDKFEDCWSPFFELFKTFWPACPYQIILNTETKEYHHPGLDIVAAKVGAFDTRKRVSWSESLLRCLNRIKSDCILYLQEDYFFSDYVNVAVLSEFLEIMYQENCSHIRLMELEGNGPWHPTKHKLLWEIDSRANYRISLQAGLWKKDRLKAYLKPGESAWQFERWGTVRAHRIPDTFYCQNLDYFNRRGKYVVPYTPTGIVQGKWYDPAVTELFKGHGIAVDFTKRGFYTPTRKDIFVRKIRGKLRRLIMKVL